MNTPPPFKNGKRYYPLSQHYQDIFGKKVYKVSVSVAKTCPNRESKESMSVCIFCDEWGSAAYNQNLGETIKKQINNNIFLAEGIKFHILAKLTMATSVPQLHQ